jgi:hypothetical protein
MNNANGLSNLNRSPHRGDYVIFVDESGDHGLQEIDRDYPVFILAFCIFKIDNYVEQIVPKFKSLKFKFFGHDLVVFHEREIRKSLGPFKILFDTELRNTFFEDLNQFMTEADFSIIACAIDKYAYRESGYVLDNPYRIAMQFGLERAFFHLQGVGERGKKTYVIFESRGKKEDDELELEFRRLMSSSHIAGMADTLRFITSSKKANSEGLQISDLVARPIGLHIHKPEQPNRAFEILKAKFRRSGSGEISGWGLKVLP